MALTPRQKALRIARVALDGKAEKVAILDLRRRSSTFDYFVVCSAASGRRGQAIAEAIEADLAASGARLRHQEGDAEGGWVLLDYGSVVAHLFTEELREFYRLEWLWNDAPRVRVPAGRRAQPV